jgi:hypothetical protein
MRSRNCIFAILAALGLLGLFVTPVIADVIRDWSFTYDRPPGGNPDYATDMVLDLQGNLYVIGSGRGATNLDMMTMKMTALGDTLWVRYFDGTAHLNDQTAGIAVSSSGNVYVAGNVDQTVAYPPTSYADMILVKYLPNGDLAWSRTYSGANNLTDQAESIVLDAEENVYISGISENNIITLKYNSQGDELWKRQVAVTPTDNSLWGGNAVLDPSGNIIVAARYSDNGSYVVPTVKYTPSGDVVWSTDRRWPGHALGNAKPRCDAAGNVYILGTYDTTESVNANSPAVFAMKYSASGAFQWLNTYSGPDAVGLDNTWVQAPDIAVDPAGYAYILAECWYLNQNPAHFTTITIKYSPDGETAWLRELGASGTNGNAGTSMLVDDAENVYITGHWEKYVSGSIDYDQMVWQYDTDGNLIMTHRSDCPGSRPDTYGKKIARDGSGNLYVVSGTNPQGASPDIYVNRLSPSASARGDANADLAVNVGDVIYIINYVFKGAPAPTINEHGDANCDQMTNVADAVYLINYVFKSGTPPRCL